MYGNPKIKNTVNFGTMTLLQGGGSHTGTGGFVGAVWQCGVCSISNCINYGGAAVESPSLGGLFYGIGGIVGYLYGSSIESTNTINVGNFYYQVASNVGGIVGRNNESGRDVKLYYYNNYYNNTKIEKDIGSGGDSVNIIKKDIVGKDEEYMKSEEFVNELNGNIEKGIEIDDTTGKEITIDTTGWAKWVYNKNSYPTLDLETKWNGTDWIKN